MYSYCGSYYNSYFEIDINKAKNFFTELLNLEKNDQSKPELFFSSTGISVVQNPAYAQGVRNYAGSCVGWSQDISQFPALTRKIKAFVSTNPAQALEELNDTVMADGIGKACAFFNSFDTNKTNKKFISEAIDDLLWIQEELHELRVLKNRKKSLPPIEGEIIPECKEIVDGYSKINDEETKSCIREMFLNSDLSELRCQKGGKDQAALQLPDQFVKDFHRQTIRLNGELFISPYDEEDENKKKETQEELLASRAQKMRVIREKYGPDVFQRLTVLLHQSTLADKCVFIGLKFSEIDLKTYEKYQLDPRECPKVLGSSPEFDIISKGDCILLDVTVNLYVQAFDNLREVKNLGYFAIGREILIPIQELTADFTGKTSEEILPNLWVRDFMSDICLTHREAKSNLDARRSAVTLHFPGALSSCDPEVVYSPDIVKAVGKILPTEEKPSDPTTFRQMFFEWKRNKNELCQLPEEKDKNLPAMQVRICSEFLADLRRLSVFLNKSCIYHGCSTDQNTEGSNEELKTVLRSLVTELGEIPLLRLGSLVHQGIFSDIMLSIILTLQASSVNDHCLRDVVLNQPSSSSSLHLNFENHVVSFGYQVGCRIDTRDAQGDLVTTGAYFVIEVGGSMPIDELTHLQIPIDASEEERWKKETEAVSQEIRQTIMPNLRVWTKISPVCSTLKEAQDHLNKAKT
jgi:hypothetical protein